MDQDWHNEVKNLKRTKTNKITFVKSPKSIIIYKKVDLNINQKKYQDLPIINKRDMPKKFTPKAKLDLHGYYKERAFEIFKEFIVNHYEKSIREVLIITGKSNRNKDIGTIKSNFKNWINDNSIRFMIISYSEASVNYGGEGAYFLNIRNKHK